MQHGFSPRRAERDYNKFPKHDVSVITGPVEGDAPESKKTIDWRSNTDRKWLTSHLHWAMLNGQAVVLTPAEPPQKGS